MLIYIFLFFFDSYRTTCLHSQSTPSNVEDGNPLWNYGTRLEKNCGKDGIYKWQCSFCNIIKDGSYTRVTAHLMKIKGERV